MKVIMETIDLKGYMEERFATKQELAKEVSRLEEKIGNTKLKMNDKIEISEFDKLMFLIWILQIVVTVETFYILFKK
jgi:hypothetical protein